MSEVTTVRYEDYLLPEPERMILPSKMPAILRYPSMKYFISLGSLPSALVKSVQLKTDAAEIRKAEGENLMEALSREPLTAEEIEDSEKRTNLLLCDVFVEPRFSMTPDPDPAKGEFHPSRLKLEDRTFVVDWVSKQLKSSERGGSADIETFPVEPATSGVAGTGS